MIYRTLLQDDFEKLPPVLRALHSSPGLRRAEGVLSVRRHNRLLAWLVGFPPEGERVPVKLEVAAAEDSETWTRWFGGRERRSRQTLADGFLIEDAGPARIVFRVDATDSGMTFRSRRSRVFGIPVPLRIEASERGGEMSWEVEVNIPRIGSYRGIMTLVP